MPITFESHFMVERELVDPIIKTDSTTTMRLVLPESDS
jgi:hypothetical protein